MCPCFQTALSLQHHAWSWEIHSLWSSVIAFDEPVRSQLQLLKMLLFVMRAVSGALLLKPLIVLLLSWRLLCLLHALSFLSWEQVRQQPAFLEVSSSKSCSPQLQPALEEELLLFLLDSHLIPILLLWISSCLSFQQPSCAHSSTQYY